MAVPRRKSRITDLTRGCAARKILWQQERRGRSHKSQQTAKPLLGCGLILLKAHSKSFHGDQHVIRKVTILVVLFLGLVIQASAQQQELIGNPAGRNATSLNGNWQIIIDPYETGYYDYRYQPRPDGYFKN